jgi:hypothetical protein
MESGEGLVIKYTFVCCLRRELSRGRWLCRSGGSYPHWELHLYYTAHANKTQSRVWKLFPEWSSLHGDPRLWVGGSLYIMLCCCIWAHACIFQYSCQFLFLSFACSKSNNAFNWLLFILYTLSLHVLMFPCWINGWRDFDDFVSSWRGVHVISVSTSAREWLSYCNKTA